jgi:hypothetical protein
MEAMVGPVHLGRHFSLSCAPFALADPVWRAGRQLWATNLMHVVQNTVVATSATLDLPAAFALPVATGFGVDGFRRSPASAQEVKDHHV